MKSIRSTMLSLFSCAALIAAPAAAQLKQIDSVLVKVDERSYLSVIGAMSVGPKGHLFVSDVAEGKIVQIDPRGVVVGTFGRKGKGPGEFTGASSITFLGDSMYVYDATQKRISVFLVSSRKFVRSFTANISRFARIAVIGTELAALVTDPQTFASVAYLDAQGSIKRREGVSPEFLKKNPMYMDLINQTALTVNGTEVWSASEYSQSLYKWKRGTTAVAEEIRLPVVRRFGVDEALLVEVMNNRANMKIAVRVYEHSTPVAIRYVAPEILGLITNDPNFDMGTAKLTGSFHLTLVDIKGRRVCPDTKLPIPAEPLPRVEYSGTDIVVLQQASDKNAEPATAIRRFSVDPKACSWQKL